MTDAIELRHQIGNLDLTLKSPVMRGITAIFGPSGAGKTTILRAIAGLVAPDAGRISISGRIWFDRAQGIDLPASQRRVGYVFQEPRLFPHLSVAQNLKYGRRQRAGAVDFDAVVDVLALRPFLARRPSGLSGGEAQRTALGRALLSDPSILLMDEPLSALDLGLKREILPFFEKLAGEANVPVFYVSHDIDEVARLADRVILVDAGTASTPKPVAEAFASASPETRVSRSIAGGLLSAQVAQFHADDGLTEARIGSQSVWVSGRAGAVGTTLRLRVDARDVTLSRNAPGAISALNILPATIVTISDGPSAGALVKLDHQGQVFSARLTQRSVRALSLEPGQQVHAIIKAMSVTADQVSQK
ncbi:MAG: molybdenum ABC transporter ATP-binding protein [Pseudomonadota bacterium]